MGNKSDAQACISSSSTILAFSAANAWLIFYTHDVDEQPRKHGCTPGLFEAALETALAEHCDILPVRNALGMIRFRQDAPVSVPWQRRGLKCEPLGAAIRGREPTLFERIS